MKRNECRAAAALVLALLLGGCAGSAVGTPGHASTSAASSPSSSDAISQQAPSSPAPSPPVPSPPTVTFTTSDMRPTCQASALPLQYRPDLVPMTGEHGGYYALVNLGRAACTLDGYPSVALTDNGGAILPFRYVHHASVYVTKAAPRRVLLPPGASAFVLVAKYRCDLGDRRDAAAIQLTLPGSAGPAMTLRFSPGLPGGADMSYCKGGPDGPGQIVGVSPIETTPAEAGRSLANSRGSTSCAPAPAARARPADVRACLVRLSPVGYHRCIRARPSH